MQDKTTIFRQRAAQQHRFVQTDGWIPRFWLDFEFFQDTVNFQVFQRLINNQPHCTFVVVLADIDYRAPKERILKSRHGNKKVML